MHCPTRHVPQIVRSSLFIITVYKILVMENGWVLFWSNSSLRYQIYILLTLYFYKFIFISTERNLSFMDLNFLYLTLEISD